jgi:hypothetical protein
MGYESNKFNVQSPTTASSSCAFLLSLTKKLPLKPPLSRWLVTRVRSGTSECATTTGEVVWIETLHMRWCGSERPRRKEILRLHMLCNMQVSRDRGGFPI